VRAAKARELVRKKFKWMPNPHGDKPGVLGTDPKAEAAYYNKYFKGGTPDQDQQPSHGRHQHEEFSEAGRLRPKRERVSPSKFWYRPDYTTPEPAVVAYMRSRELKFAMMHEAHLVRMWRCSQPENCMDALPPGTRELWMAFGHRAADLAQGKLQSPLAAAVGSEAPDVENARGSRAARCSLPTTLRFLQALASVRAGPFSALQRLVSRVGEGLEELKPVEGFYLLQALARLRMRHSKTPAVLQKMHLAWRALPATQFIKAANAVAKLDLAGTSWARPLKAALVAALPRLSGRHLASLKSITVMELLDQPAALASYLEHCERERSCFVYSRHLMVVEVHVHLLYPEVWKDLGDHIRLFLEELRTAHEQGRSEAHGRRAKHRGSSTGNGDGDSDSDNDEAEGDVRRTAFDKRLYNSELHQDVSRVLREGVGVDHDNRLAAGPMMLDICHLPTMTVLEAAAPWQYYLRSPRVTALARRRHEMLRAMGFKLVQVPFHRWGALPDDEAKAGFLREVLPAGMMAYTRSARIEA